MQKIISLFKRDYTGNRVVINEVTPGAEWVMARQGIATKKFDGMCCKIENGTLFKRYDAKNGKTPPVGFIPAQEPDPITGHWPGWIKVSLDNPADIYFIEGHINTLKSFSHFVPGGTYELCGPKINGNPERLPYHLLIPHAKAILYNVPLWFEALRDYLTNEDMEGIVWHHPDGRMVKIKGKDFGIKRPK